MGHSADGHSAKSEEPVSKTNSFPLNRFSHSTSAKTRKPSPADFVSAHSSELVSRDLINWSHFSLTGCLLEAIPLLRSKFKRSFPLFFFTEICLEKWLIRNSVLGASVQRRPLCHGCGKLMSEESDDRQPPMPSSTSGRAAPSPHRCHYPNRKYPQRLSPRFLDEEPKNPLATTPPVAPKASMRDLYADGAGSGTSDSASSSGHSCKSSL